MEQMRNFAQVIPAQAEPLVSSRQSARTLAGTPAIALSARTGRPVRVDDLPARR
jgi:hypothetical protein